MLKTIGLGIIAFLAALWVLHLVAGLVISFLGTLVIVAAVTLVGYGFFKFVL